MKQSRDLVCNVPLGIGGTFCNHSDNTNMQVKRLIDEEMFEFYALRDIVVGEELTHKYFNN